jgi:ferredoxin-NADP reductase
MEEYAEGKGLYLQTVTWVHHWTSGLFSFRTDRPASFRFASGEFVMIGLLGPDGKPVMRAYSIVSPSWEEHLEFFSVKVRSPPAFSTSRSATRSWSAASLPARWSSMRCSRASTS